MFELKESKRKLEQKPEIKQEIRCKLDPSLLAHSEVPIDRPSNLGPTMMLRRRANGGGPESGGNFDCELRPSGYPIILPRNSTYLPSKNQTNEANGANSNANELPRARSKIFSIATSVSVVIIVVSLIAIFCLCICNKSNLLVNAQYSIQNDPNSNKEDSNDNDNKHTISQPSVYPPRPVIGKTVAPKPSSGSTADERNRQVSIDRFDSGEQIRPPFLRQPTTLQPLIREGERKEDRPQRRDEAYQNLQTAASQDSYLSPEDREQLLRSQESHYEGKNSDQSQPSNLDSSSSNGRPYERPIRWSQQQNGDNQESVEPRPSFNQESQLGAPESSMSGASGGSDNDDGDYEDETSEQDEKKKVNLVPENRRMATGGYGANYDRGQLNQRPTIDAVAAANEDGDPSDDYGGANDDLHFSRKSSPLKLAATQHNNRGAHQQHQHQHNKQRLSSTNAGRYHPASDSQPYDGPNEREESQGFGPGPNEAYIIDKAESGKAGIDNDDEGSYPSAGEGAGDSLSGNEMADNKFDRRSMNDQRAGQASSGSGMPYSPPANYGRPIGGQQRAAAAAMEAGDTNSDESPDDADGSEDSESAYAPSSASAKEMKPHESESSLNQRISTNGAPAKPATSASVAIAAAQMPPRYEAPIGAKKPNQNPLSIDGLSFRNSRASYSSNQQQQQQQHQQQPQPSPSPQQQQANRMNTFGSSIAAASGGGQSNKLAAVPYNPQNNPSHAGKYFIN